MKKILFVLIVGSLLFAANSDNTDKKLDLILQKLNQLEQKVNQKDKEIEKLKKELQKQQSEIKKQELNTKKEFAVKSCDNLKVTAFDYKYHNNALPYITFNVTIKNNYPYEITKINGNIYFDDKDGTTMIKHFINRKVSIKPGESITISGQHMLVTDIEKMMKDEKPTDLEVHFDPTVLTFKNAQKLECF